MFVIAGTGRSGTKWCATALRTVGIFAGHEQAHRTSMLPNLDPPQWDDGMDGDVSLAAVPYLPDHDGPKVLVVRHPLDVVTSIVTVGPLLAGSQPSGLLDRVRQDHPAVFDQPDEPHAAAAYWLAWNWRATQHADVVLRVEDLTVDRLCVAVGVEPRWPPIPGLPPVGAGPKSGRTPWEGLRQPLRGEVAGLAQSFGYAAPS